MGGAVRRITRNFTKPLKKAVKEVAKISPVTEQVARAVGVTEEPKAAEPVKPKAAARSPAAAPAEKAGATQAAATVTPKAATGAGGAMGGEAPTRRRRRGRGIATGSRGVTGGAPVERKSLLGG